MQHKTMKRIRMVFAISSSAVSAATAVDAVGEWFFGSNTLTFYDDVVSEVHVVTLTGTPSLSVVAGVFTIA